MKTVYSAILILCLSLVSFAGNEGSEKTITKTIFGKVTDSTGESIPGAKIVIKQTGETFYADLDGNFKFTIKTDKEYSVSVTTIGYQILETKSTQLSSFSDFTLKPL